MNNKIAVFADIEHVKLSYEGFKAALGAIKSEGEIAYCKFYNFKPLRHAEYIPFINTNGFEAVNMVKVIKKRNKCDMRLVLDAYNMGMTNNGIDTFFIIAEGYLVPLVAALKKFGKTVYCGVIEDIDGLNDVAHGIVKLPAPAPKQVRIAANRKPKELQTLKKNDFAEEDMMGGSSKGANVDDLDNILSGYVKRK